MKSVYYLVFIAVLLASCSTAPSGNAIGTAVAQTLTAKASAIELVATNTFTPKPKVLSLESTLAPTNKSTPIETRTPQNTHTQAPTRTPTATISAEELRTNLSTLIALGLPKGVSDIETVNMVRFANNRFEIEIKTRWASQDRQPDVSYKIVQFFAAIFVDNFAADVAAKLADSDKFSLYLVTYSTDGDYRYESTTDYDRLVKLNNHVISYDEWVAASNAGFR